MMNESHFWSIIHLLDRSKPWVEGADWDMICAPVVDALSAMDEKQIAAFFEVLAQKLYDLNTPEHHKYARHPGLLGLILGKMTSDGFLYARLHVVALGREHYLSVLKKPESFPTGMWFEHLLYVADRAFERVTGQDFPRDSAVDFESFSNTAWNTK